jgi:hypothetical protein
MSVLRKKYYSLQTGTFVDVPTTANLSLDSTDISSVYNDETIRLIRFGDDIESAKMDELVADLLHNDQVLFDNYQKLNSLISNGTFYSVGDSFKIYDVQKVDYLDGTYITSFGVRSGQIKYEDEVIFLDSEKYYKNASPNASGSGFITINDTNNISTGSIVFGSEFETGTQITGITGTTLQLSKNLKTNISNNSLVLFMNIPTFKVGNEISEITGDFDVYPVWRRDLISYDLKNSNWETLKGSELITIPPINTQLDVMYQIMSITHVSGNIHQIKYKKNNRNINSDFSIGDFLTINKSNNKTFDGQYEIININSINNTINVRIPLFRDSSKNQVLPGGFIDLKILGLLSILVYKANPNSPTLIIDDIQNISTISGISGGVQNIIQAQISPDQEYYRIKSNDYVHLIDLEGRLLDWEEGQGTQINPELGYSYNEDDLQNYDQTQIPFPNYAPIENGNLTNIPFILQQIDNNVFGLTSVDLIQIKIGIKNNTISIGQEGITYRVTTYPTIGSQIKVHSSSVQRDSNGNIVKTTIINPLIDFTTLGISITRKDFILIVDGKGSHQIGKIINFGNEVIEVSGLSKELDNTSEYLIFQNTITVITDSENFIESENIRGQVLSGVNGLFGDQNIYSKVSLTYPGDVPKIELKRWYFLDLKGYTNDIIQQGTPYIVIENPTNSNQDASSSFVEIFYTTVTGKYPNGNLLIEDEFGDISLEFKERGEAPHFRPTKYQVIARSLDQLLDYPQDTDEVFVDVHIGQVKFAPESKPRKVFISYNKYDTIDGNSTDFSIKHVDVEQSLKVNIQDKIAEIDSRFNSETEIKKSWIINGLISEEDSGFCGPINVDFENSYNVVYKDPAFTNFSFDEEKYVVKFNNHLYDQLVFVGQNNLLLDKVSLEVVSGNNGDSLVHGTLINSLDFLDYKDLTSGTTLPQVGINFYDESFVPVSDSFYNSENVFIKKKLILETPSESSQMSIDNGLYDISNSVDGKWNYLYSHVFDKNVVLYGLLRKSNYESLNINSNKDIKRRFKQREIIKILDRNFNDINTSRSETKIISERYLSKSLILDSIKHKENFIYLRSEITQYKNYKFLSAQNLSGTSLSLNNIDTSISGVDALFKRDNIFINNSLVVAYLDPLDNNKPKLRFINFIKNEESSDIGSQSSVSNINVDNNIAYEIKICAFNNGIAVGYVSQRQSTFYIKIKIYSKTGVYESNSEFEVTSLVSPFYFNISAISNNSIAIVWKKTENDIGLISYSYTLLNGARVGSLKIIESDNSLQSPPTICKFSKDSFLIGYSNISGAKIKIFNINNNLDFFDNNKTIDFRLVTPNNIPNISNMIKVLELDNNNIAIAFLDKKPNETFDLKLVILDSWTKNWSYPSTSANTSSTLSIPILLEADLTTPISSISLSIVNEDIFVISYIKSGKINLRGFRNDGGEIFHNFEDSLTGISSLITSNVGQSTIISSYIENNNSYKYSVYNFRPDFTINSSINNSFELSQFNNNFFKTFNYINNNYISIIQNKDNLSKIEIKVISTEGKNSHSINDNYSPLEITLTNLNKILDVKFINYNYDSDMLNLLIFLWSDGTNIKVNFVKIDNSLIINGGDFTLSLGSFNYFRNFGQFIQLSNNIIGILLRNDDNKYHIHGFNISVFQNNDTFGIVDSNKYTDISQIYNPVNNILSGVNIEHDISFFKKSNDYGYLVYPSNNGTVISDINLTNGFTVGSNFSLASITSSTRNVVNAGLQLSYSNVIQNNIDEDEFIIIANSSGTGVYFGLNFSSDTQYINSSGVYYSSSGVNGQISNVSFINNSASDDNYIISYNENISSTSTNNVRVKFFNKITKQITNMSPLDTVLFNDLNKGNQISVIKSNFNDLYFTFISDSKIVSKTFSNSMFSDPLEIETPIIESDKIGGNRTRLYLKNSLKVGGINWKGDLIKTYPAFSIPSLNLDGSQIDEDGIFRSEMLKISSHLVSISKDSFIVIYHYQKDKDSEIKIKLRNFVISRGRVFPDSDWYSGTPELSFEGIQNNIYLECIENPNGILYVWVDPVSRKIRKTLVDKFNVIVGTSFGQINQPLNSEWILLGSSSLIEGWSTVIAYDKNSNKIYTLLFDPDSNLHRFGSPFSLPFEITTTLRSTVTVSKFGYFTWLYLDSSQNLKYYQHGFDGDPWGIVQIVGKNYITNIESSPNSPISEQISEDIFKSAEFKFLQYNRVDYTINNGVTVNIIDVFRKQETALYRVFNLDDPTLNIVIGLKAITGGEPVISVDTSSDFVSIVSGTLNKFNIYISSNLLNFQNNTGEILRLRFYKEN